jgi:hypothetical protein
MKRKQSDWGGSRNRVYGTREIVDSINRFLGYQPAPDVASMPPAEIRNSA